jgi:multiple sugar transport system substrate-binding protein
MRKVTRRGFIGATALAAAGLAGACAPRVVEVEKIVRETVEVEKPVEQLVTVVPTLALEDLPYATNVKAKGRVRFWHCWGEARLRLMIDMISDFHEHYPDVVVENLLMPCGDLTHKYLTAIAGGDPPEVMMLFSSDLAKFVGGDALRPLDDLVARDGLDLDRYYPAEVGARTYGGQLYLLPQVSALAKTMMFCNDAVMEDAGITVPTTWEELLEASRKVLKVEGGKVVRNGFYPMYHPQPLDPCFATWLTLSAGQMINESMDRMTFNSPEGVDALKFMLEGSDINTDGRPEDMLVTGETEYFTLMRQGFVNDELAFYIHGSWMFMLFDALGMPVDRYTLAPVPKNGNNPNAKFGTATEGGWGFGIPKMVKDPDPAWEWVKFTCYGPAGGTFTKAQVRPNPVREYNEDPDLLRNPHWQTMLEIMDQEVAYPVTEAWPRQRERIRDMSWNVLYHKETPEQALEAAWKECQAELDKVKKG